MTLEEGKIYAVGWTRLHENFFTLVVIYLIILFYILSILKIKTKTKKKKLPQSSSLEKKSIL